MSGLNAEPVGEFYALGDRALLNPDGTVSKKGSKQSVAEGEWYVDATPEGETIRYCWSGGMWFRTKSMTDHETPMLELCDSKADEARDNDALWPVWKWNEILVLGAAVAIGVYVLVKSLIQ